MEISECFPNKFKPVWGDFILQHVRALSGYCSVIIIVPLRYIPPKELFSINPARFLANLYKWFTGILMTSDFEEKDLKVIFIPFVTLPRPYFDSLNKKITGFFFYDRIRKKLLPENPDLIYCNWIRPWADVSAKLAGDFNVPLIIDHHEDIPTLKKLLPGDHVNVLKNFEKADGIIVHSSFNKLDLENESLKLPEIRTIYLGQKFPVNDSKKEFNFSEIRLLCVSHLSEPRKNIDILIKSMKIICGKIKSNLIITGDGNLKQNYEKLSGSLSLNNSVTFTGSKSQNEVGKLLDISDIFILPSFPEAFGVVFIEALAKGLPVVTCRGNGGGEELLKLGYPVILAEPHSAESLADSVLDLISDKDKMTLMSESGKKIVKKYFTWDKNAESTYDYILQLTDKHHTI